ncbi:MAG TPA: MBL fold metallo-hydrolase [Candidatus Limnocylindria bacterium]|nr:MBL fold metallo-hydrolase [Candidatus Limnocylindria bacterium]
MQTPEPSRARDSAAVVFVRGHGDALEAYWVKRSDAVEFMPGFRAFVGGAVAREDEALEIEGVAAGPERVMRACAIREAFEETGVLIGVVDPGPPERVAAARERLLAGEVTFPELARDFGWQFRADGLEYCGRWVTPPFAYRRFDTWYFLARVPQGQEPHIMFGELAEGEWVRPLQALERWQLGQETFAAPILYNLIALAEGEQDLVPRMIAGPERAGSPRRIELKWGVVLHPAKTRPLPPATHTNVYLVGEQEMAMIDPGCSDPEEQERLFALVELLAEDRRRLKLVLLTHHHPDHIGAVEAVRARYQVLVAGHAETGKHVRLDFSLEDGEFVPLVPGVGDWNLQAVHTPGHTRGHLCFYHGRTRSLFTGDHVVGGGGTVVIDPPEGDMADYVRSLERVIEMPVEVMFPGHGPPQGAAKRSFRWLLKHRQGREAQVLAALDAEPHTLAALVERAYQDTAKELWPYAERSLLAHLLKLEGEGRARREGEGWMVAANPDRR